MPFQYPQFPSNVTYLLFAEQNNSLVSTVSPYRPARTAERPRFHTCSPRTQVRTDAEEKLKKLQQEIAAAEAMGPAQVQAVQAEVAVLQQRVEHTEAVRASKMQQVSVKFPQGVDCVWIVGVRRFDGGVRGEGVRERIV